MYVHARRVLQRSLKGLQINQNASEYLETAVQCQTHLVQAQNRAQRSHRGWEQRECIGHMHACAVHAIDVKTAARTREDVSKTPNKAKPPNLPIVNGGLVQRRS